MNTFTITRRATLSDVKAGATLTNTRTGSTFPRAEYKVQELYENGTARVHVFTLNGGQWAPNGVRVMNTETLAQLRVTVTLELSNGALSLFKELATDAPNWHGEPLLDISSPEDKGYLTALKKLELITTSSDEGWTWARFTKLGEELAYELAIPLH